METEKGNRCIGRTLRGSNFSDPYLDGCWKSHECVLVISACSTQIVVFPWDYMDYYTISTSIFLRWIAQHQPPVVLLVLLVSRTGASGLDREQPERVHPGMSFRSGQVWVMEYQWTHRVGHGLTQPSIRG